MIDLASLKRELLTDCQEDHVGLWEVVRMVERRTPQWDEAKVKDYTLDLLEGLLSTGEIEAGFPAENGRDFESWKLPASKIIAKIRDEWQPGKKPTIGEVAWFTTPTDVHQTA